MKANILSSHTLPTPWVGSKCQIFIFSEYGHVVNQIKEYDAYSKMVANILSIDTPSGPGLGQKVKAFFSESSHDAYQIKGNGA